MPEVTKPLLFIHRFTNDNKYYFEFHPNHFVVKDQETMKELLRGWSDHGLYKLSPTSLFQVFYGVVNPEEWHARFGHSNMHTINKFFHISNYLVLLD